MGIELCFASLLSYLNWATFTTLNRFCFFKSLFLWVIDEKRLHLFGIKIAILSTLKFLVNTSLILTISSCEKLPSWHENELTWVPFALKISISAIRASALSEFWSVGWKEKVRDIQSNKSSKQLEPGLASNDYFLPRRKQD